MPTQHKIDTVDELATKLRDMKAAVIVDYRGLNVKDITALRRQLAGDGIELQVAKNTLLRLAARQAEVEIDPELLTGPTAIAFGNQDEVAVARQLTDYTRRSRIVELKGGIISGTSLNAEQVTRLADLPPREVLLSQLIGVIQAPLSKTLGTIQAPAREIAGLALALHDKNAGGEAAA
jgi:large subunit ribosomal protein L10